VKYKLPPYEWQHKALGEASKSPEYALLCDMGTGKSGAMVNILRDKMYQENRQLKILILSPLITLFNWKNEFKKHSYIDPDKIVVLHKSGSIGKLKQLDKEVINTVDKDKIIVVNYEALLSDKVFDELVKWKPDVLVCDESHYVKNYKAKRSKKVLALSMLTKYRYIMTGTPILNDASDIFMQYKILDHGRTFGDDIFTFKAVYMQDMNAAWKGRQGYFPNYVIRNSKVDELNSKIYAKGIRVTKEECLDLPPLVNKLIRVELGKDQRKYYEEMKRDFLTFVQEGEAKGVAIAQLAMTKALRLQQIATGYISDQDKNIIEIKDNPRLGVVKELLQTLQSKHKVILWYHFRYNRIQLARVLEELKINFVEISGDMNLEKKNDAMYSFENDDNVRVILANRKAGGIGVNLVAASYSIVYSRDFSLGVEKQSADRNYRGGSEIHDKITRLNLCAMDTIDESVTEALINKEEISNSIISMVRGNYANQ